MRQLVDKTLLRPVPPPNERAQRVTCRRQWPHRAGSAAHNAFRPHRGCVGDISTDRLNVSQHIFKLGLASRSRTHHARHTTYYCRRPVRSAGTHGAATQTPTQRTASSLSGLKHGTTEGKAKSPTPSSPIANRQPSRRVDPGSRRELSDTHLPISRCSVDFNAVSGSCASTLGSRHDASCGVAGPRCSTRKSNRLAIAPCHSTHRSHASSRYNLEQHAAGSAVPT